MKPDGESLSAAIQFAVKILRDSTPNGNVMRLAAASALEDKAAAEDKKQKAAVDACVKEIMRAASIGVGQKPGVRRTMRESLAIIVRKHFQN